MPSLEVWGNQQDIRKSVLFKKPVTVPIFSAVERVGEVTISSSVTIKGMTAVLRSCCCCASGWGDTPDEMLSIFFWVVFDEKLDLHISGSRHGRDPQSTS